MTQARLSDERAKVTRSQPTPNRVTFARAARANVT